MYGLPGVPTTDLGATLTLRTLRTATHLLPDMPAPPEIQRARRLVHGRDDVSEQTHSSLASGG
jgi:hypothetical protein